MGRVVVEVVIENLRDLWDAESGRLAAADIRRVALADALVDTGATTLSLPTRFIEQLGLKKRSEKRVSTSGGDAIASLYDAVRLTVRDRQCTVDVLDDSHRARSGHPPRSDGNVTGRQHSPPIP